MGIKETMEQVQREQAQQEMRTFMENARNAMRAVKIAIQEGDEEEALRLIDEALGDDEEPSHE